MPSFCRHSRLIQNCPICSREQNLEMRPLVSGVPSSESPPAARRTRPRRPSAPPGGLRVRRLARGVDDGYQCGLVPGLRSSEDAARLADELAFAARRLERLRSRPPGLFAEVADARGDLEERSWLAFLISYLGPLEGEEPFSEIERVRTSWASGELPALEGVRTGPRGAHDPARGERTLQAYRAWATRAGSQERAFTGDAAWTPQRRFARAFERLALPGLHRDARFELLSTLGALGVYELEPGALALGGNDVATLAAKRALGIGDPMLLERRAGALAEACGVPPAALDLALFNWERGERSVEGVAPEAEDDQAALQVVRSALGL